jgi:hypothetical protein
VVYQCRCGLRGILIVDTETREERVEGDLYHITDPELYSS